MKMIAKIALCYLATLSIAVAADRKPCAPIEKACIQAGYYKGGYTQGKGLLQNCMQPIIEGKTVPNVHVDELVLKACQLKALEKAKQNKQTGN